LSDVDLDVDQDAVQTDHGSRLYLGEHENNIYRPSGFDKSG